MEEDIIYARIKTRYHVDSLDFIQGLPSPTNFGSRQIVPSEKTYKVSSIPGPAITFCAKNLAFLVNIKKSLLRSFFDFRTF